MEIQANKTKVAGSISAFLPIVRHLPSGATHVGFICDAATPLSAQIKLYGMATSKMPIEQVKQDEIFTLEF